ncbi:hypothetical protein PS838_02829 [Pseudomonas fluorescens]|nr:hypothetical protein PS838_02829 [Pseudomonas fluorescens]
MSSNEVKGSDTSKVELWRIMAIWHYLLVF